MDLKHAGKLTPAVRQALSSREPAYERPVVPPGWAGDAGVRRQVESLASDGLLDPPVASGAGRDALMAGLWLWHDFLDESHALSQHVASPTGSFWHAIMHRREGDFSNAKYWYARCRSHPALADVGSRAAHVADELRAGGGDVPELPTGTAWDPDAFVDLVARVHRQPGTPHHAAAVRLQRVEWAALFDHCIAEAAGR